MDPFIPRRLLVSIALLLGVIGAGTAGYVWLERYGWFDAFYATVTSMTTVGGGEVRPFHVAGKVWTMLVVGIGFIAFTDAIVSLVGFVVEGKLGAAVSGGRMRRRVRMMRDHFILCGFGRVGREIAADFWSEDITFVVVDASEAVLRDASALGYAIVRGDAADEETLKQAGVMAARGLVTAVDSDADNVFVTLTARVMRPDIFIVARMNAIETGPKLKLAGANRVASPYIIGGRRLASLATRPTAVDFVDTVLSAKNAQLVLEDFKIGADSQWIGRPISDIFAIADDAIILAVKRADTMMFRPLNAVTLQIGDELVLAGRAPTIRALELALGGS